MRLVDADALSKLVGEPIEVFLRRLDLKLPPTVDAVEVVRCKDCIHRMKNGMCEYKDYSVVAQDDNDFCSWGERREDETG